MKRTTVIIDKIVDWESYIIDSYQYYVKSEADLHYVQAEMILNSRMYMNHKTVSYKLVNVIRLILSELGTNILKYAVKGKLIVSIVKIDGVYGIKIDAIDKGGGIKNIEEALKDHYSSGTSLGLGLPAVKRLVDWFKIESELGRGTHIECVLLINE